MQILNQKALDLSVSCFLESFVASRKETVTLLLTSVARIMKH